jgi:hypothetical protein
MNKTFFFFFSAGDLFFRWEKGEKGWEKGEEGWEKGGEGWEKGEDYPLSSPLHYANDNCLDQGFM